MRWGMPFGRAAYTAPGQCRAPLALWTLLLVRGVYAYFEHSRERSLKKFAPLGPGASCSSAASFSVPNMRTSYLHSGPNAAHHAMPCHAIPTVNRVSHIHHEADTATGGGPRSKPAVAERGQARQEQQHLPADRVHHIPAAQTRPCTITPGTACVQSHPSQARALSVVSGCPSARCECVVCCPSHNVVGAQ